jgi:hypothetical protein
MGLLPGGKARKEQAKVLKIQREALEEERAAELPWYAQPSVGAALRNAARRRMAQRSEG